jgi:hypothetical protein
MAKTKNKKAQPTEVGPNTPNTAGAGMVAAPAPEADRSLTVPVAKAKTIKPSSTERTAPKIGAVIKGLDLVGQKVYARLLKIAPDFNRQLESLQNANDTKLKEQLDEYKEEDYKLGQDITKMMKKRRQLFRENIGLFWTIHECIVSPGFRSDLNAGRERTADYNFKTWGACTWQEFVERYSPYGLDATDNYVKEFGRECSLLLNKGAAGDAKSVIREAEHEVADARPKKKRRQTVIEMANAKLAGEFKSMCKLALNSGATAEQIAATWKSKAQETYKSLAPAESKALKMPKILEPKQTELETLGITLAKQVWASTLLPGDSREKQAAHKVLLKAGISATIAPGPSWPQTDPKLGPALNDQDAERVMVLVAKGKDVKPDELAKYETWVAAKGDTDRANALRDELSKWKDAIKKKAQKSSAQVPNGSTVDTSAQPVTGIIANSRSTLAVTFESMNTTNTTDTGIKQEVQQLSSSSLKLENRRITKTGSEQCLTGYTTH